MYEIYVTYVENEHVDNHDYDGTTADDDHDNNNDIYARAFKARVNTSIYIGFSCWSGRAPVFVLGPMG